MWQKAGLIFNVNGQYDWNKTHAQVPVADVLDDRIRIYYATRDSQGLSRTSFIEVDKNDPSKILYEHPDPILQLGTRGTFDDSGIMPSSIINVGKKKYLYYIGWTQKVSVPYHNSIGLAVSEDGGVTFSKAFEGPIITVQKNEPHFSGTAFVSIENELFRMWYLSCIKWEVRHNKIEPFYHIKYSESMNGVDWLQTGKVAIDLKNEEGGIASAAVIKLEYKYVMWYGVRGQFNYRLKDCDAYKIGYAESADGVQWKRKDSLAGIQASETGWDSEMISYPYVIRIHNRILMFYNGNGFGKSGFGYAFMDLN